MDQSQSRPARSQASLLKFILGLAVGLTIVGAIYFATARPTEPTAIQPTGPIGENVGQVSSLVPETTRVGLGVGQLAPDFSWKDNDGKEIRLSSLRGKAVMVNFFATWCAPCRAETPDLQALYQEKLGQGFVLLMVDGDKTENLGQVSKFARDYSIISPILADPQAVVANRYNVQGFPTSYFIDKDGIIRDVQPASLSRNAMLQRITRILP